MFQYKLVAFDIDGVLNEHGENIQPESKAAIAKLVEAGFQIAYASGKHVWYVCGGLVWSGLMKADTFIIGENGGVVFDPRSRKMLIKEENIDDVRLLRNIVYNLHLKRNGFIRFGNITVWEEPKQTLFNLFPQDAQDSERLGQILEGIITENNLNLYISINPDSVDVLQKGVNKLEGTKVLCEWLGILPQEVIAFGDSFNDQEMLEGAGFAVAVNNAKDEIKEIVKAKGRNGYLARDPYGKGVLEAVNYILK